MSRGLICDQCGATLAVDSRGDDALGESAGWIPLSPSWGAYDCCSRSCVSALMEDPAFVAASEAAQEAVAEVVRTLRGEESDDA